MKTCKLTLLLLALCAALLFTLCGCDDKKDPAPTDNTPSATQGDTNNQGSEQGGSQNDDDTQGGAQGGGQADAEPDKFSVSGNTYVASSAEVTGADEETTNQIKANFETSMKGSTVTFAADGTFQFTSVSGGNVQNGTWTQTDKTVSVTVSGDTIELAAIENGVVTTETHDGVTVKVTYTKTTGGNQGGTGEQPPIPATEGLEYALNADGNSYSVTGFGTATDTDIVIAATYEGKPVTGIGEEAFYTYHSLTSITIPSSVTNIGNRAFYACYNLTSITIPSSVTSIGYGAFRGCEALASVMFGENIQLTSISGDMFRECKSLASITIPSTVASIESSAFYGCRSLSSVTIPAAVTSIGGYAFYGCTSLASVTFEITDGWWVSDSYGATSGKNVPATTVGDPRLAALRLSDTSYEYYEYDWHRS